jgi:serine/threonine protein kinase
LALTTGTRLGVYEVTSQIGVGGMGEIYRAHDSKLGRDVAVKILPDLFARDPERLSRFEREARLLASLSHPNILAIHDFGVADGTAYAVTELLHGETLGQTLQSGAMPERRAIDVAVAIASATVVEFVNGRSRDVKPRTSSSPSTAASNC